MNEPSSRDRWTLRHHRSPGNSLVMANQILFSWLAFFEGGHAFLFQSFRKFADTVNVFVK